MLKKLTLALLSAGVVAAPAPVLAKGCIRGAVAGGVAGHYAGHHAIAGAMAAVPLASITTSTKPRLPSVQIRQTEQ